MKTNLNPLEKVIESKVCKFAESLGCLQYKFTSPQRRSVPDRIFFYQGKTWLIEFKRRGEKPTPAQAVEHEKLRRVKALVFVVDNVEAGKKLVEEMVEDKSERCCCSSYRSDFDSSCPVHGV